MSKFLKFIVHFVVICTILCVVALAVPPFFGVTTEIRDDSTVKSNLAMGSVTYAIPVKTEEAALGTPILVNDENAVYRYTLASADVANGTGTAMDPTVSQGQPINVAIGSYLPKIVVTIPFIGYLMAATKSIEGLIVLGLTVLFLIILYVIAELWKKDLDDYDDYPEDTEPGYVKSRKELKKEEKRKEREYRDEEREIKAQGKRSKKEKRKIRTGGFVDEIDEDDFDVEEEEKGFLGFFKRGSNKLTSMKAKYAKAETNVDAICHTLEGHQMQLLKDIAMLDKMYELNKVYFKELSMYILAGKKKLAQTRAEQLPILVEKAKQTGLPEDAQAANDLSSLCGRFEKKLHDLELTRMISIQMAPQIRLVQNNDTLMSEKIQSTLVNTIPLWKSQMVLALGVAHSQQAAQAQREVTDMTNELLRKNADTLKMAAVETAKESERGIVDIETLKHTNESLISTLDEVLRIQQEGRQKRREAELEMGRIENELKQKLLEING